MRLTTGIAAFLAAATLLSWGVPSMSSEADEKKAAVEAANTWLALIDKGQYGKAWDIAAPMMKKAAPKGKFEAQVKPVRAMFGKVLSRRIKSEQYTKTLPGAPDGEYVVIQFDTDFEKKSAAVETITPMKDQAGHWKVSGYFIK